MIKFLPSRIDGDANQINQSFRRLDGLIFGGGLPGVPHLPYESMDLDEYSKHYEPDATPKTLPRHRTPSHVLTNYKRAVKELISINREGHYLPAWFFCLSFSYLPLTVGSPELTWDRYDRSEFKTHPVRRVDHYPLSGPSKRNSLRELVDFEFTKYGREVSMYHSNDMGFRPSNLAGDSEFMSQFDVICKSSQTDFVTPVKLRPDRQRTLGDGVNFQPESMDPEFADLIEHKVHPIYASQSYSKTFYKYEDKFMYEDIDSVFHHHVMYSRFFLSLVMRNKFDMSQLQSDFSHFGQDQDRNERRTVEDAFQQYVSVVRELHPHLKKQMILNTLDFELEQSLQIADNHKTDAQSQSPENSALDCISFMAYIDKAIYFHNLSLIWK